jgi:hypothetical protein
MDISLDLHGSSSIADALARFFHSETLDGANKYFCESCKKLTSTRKQMFMLKAPKVLVIQLKRFEGINGGKINRNIEFKEALDLSDCMYIKNQPIVSCAASSDFFYSPPRGGLYLLDVIYSSSLIPLLDFFNRAQIFLPPKPNPEAFSGLFIGAWIIYWGSRNLHLQSRVGSSSSDFSCCRCSAQPPAPAPNSCAAPWLLSLHGRRTELLSHGARPCARVAVPCSPQRLPARAVVEAFGCARPAVPPPCSVPFAAP